MTPFNDHTDAVTTTLTVLAEHGADLPDFGRGLIVAAIAGDDWLNAAQEIERVVYAARSDATAAWKLLGAQHADFIAAGHFLVDGRNGYALGVKVALLRDLGTPDPTDTGAANDPAPLDGYGGAPVVVGPPSLADQKAAILAGLDVKISAEIDGGFVFAGHPYQSDKSSIDAMQSATGAALGAIIAGSPAGNLRWANPTKDFAWVDSNNVQVPMDARTVVALSTTGVALATQVVLNGNTLKAEVRAAPDVATLDAIDITAGWPA